MIKRKWKVDKPAELLPLLNELRDRAKEQPGYISSETLRSIESPEDFVVISRWQSAEDWKKWQNSSERRKIQGRVDSMIGEKTFYEIFETIA
jgi:heme-degrading monooxygenase HmoA